MPLQCHVGPGLKKKKTLLACWWIYFGWLNHHYKWPAHLIYEKYLIIMVVINIIAGIFNAKITLLNRRQSERICKGVLEVREHFHIGPGVEGAVAVCHCRNFFGFVQSVKVRRDSNDYQSVLSSYCGLSGQLHIRTSDSQHTSPLCLPQFWNKGFLVCNSPDV